MLSDLQQIMHDEPMKAAENGLMSLAIKRIQATSQGGVHVFHLQQLAAPGGASLQRDSAPQWG